MRKRKWFPYLSLPHPGWFLTVRERDKKEEKDVVAIMGEKEEEAHPTRPAWRTKPW